METFANSSDRSFVQFDAGGKVIVKPGDKYTDKSSDEGYDVESQAIKSDFKRPPY